MQYDVLLIHPPAIYDFRKRITFPGPIAHTLAESTDQFITIPFGMLTSIADYLDRNGYKTFVDNVGFEWWAVTSSTLRATCNEHARERLRHRPTLDSPLSRGNGTSKIMQKAPARTLSWFLADSLPLASTLRFFRNSNSWTRSSEAKQRGLSCSSLGIWRARNR